MHDTTDADLLRDFAAGDHHSFAALVSRHGPMVHATALRILGNHHDAQDVTQAAFLVLARKASKLANSPSVGGWLHTVSRSLALNARKSRESRKRREHTFSNETMESASHPDLRAGFRREIDAALETLPERYRHPLVLFHLEDVPIQEIARRLQVNSSTLRTRLERGREKLRAILGKRGVGIASVSALAALFAEEAKAAGLGSAVLSAALEAAARGPAAASPHILQLAAGARSVTAGTTFSIIMKTNTANKLIAVSAVLLLIGAGTATYLIHHQPEGSNHSGNGEPQASADAGTAMGTRKTRIRPTEDPLALIRNEDEFAALLGQVLLIDDDDDRLAAIRDRLGMDIPDELYRDVQSKLDAQTEPYRAFQMLQMAWAEEDPAALVLWAARFPGELGAKFTRKHLAEWMNRDETAALAWAAENVTQEQTDRAKEIAERDRANLPKPAAETTAKLRGLNDQLLELGASDSERREDLVSEMRSGIYELRRSDPKAAVDFALSLDDEIALSLNDGVRGRLMGFLFKEWAQADPDAALSRAKELDDDTERLSALAGVLPSWQLKHPDQTLDDAVDLASIPDADYANIVSTIVSRWAMADPAAAMVYAKSIEDPAQKQRLAVNVVSSWMVKDPEAARQWVIDQPVGPTRDHSLGTLSEWTGKTDLAAANRLVSEISDATLRGNTAKGILSGSDAVAGNLTDALALAESVPNFNGSELLRITGNVSPKDLPRFREWVEAAAANRFTGSFGFADGDEVKRATLRYIEERQKNDR